MTYYYDNHFSLYFDTKYTKNNESKILEPIWKYKREITTTKANLFTYVCKKELKNAVQDSFGTEFSKLNTTLDFGKETGIKRIHNGAYLYGIKIGVFQAIIKVKLSPLEKRDAIDSNTFHISNIRDSIKWAIRK